MQDGFAGIAITVNKILRSRGFESNVRGPLCHGIEERIVRILSEKICLSWENHSLRGSRRVNYFKRCQERKVLDL